VIAASAGTIALEARGVEHRFAPGRGLSATTFAHQGPGMVAVLGPNGAGKSTLLRMVAGLLRPTLGTLELRVDGRTVPPAERRRVVGFAAPELSFYDELSVGENLAFVAEARGLSDRAGVVREALERVGLFERLDDRVAALSSGMKQRMRLAFALLHRPPLLLLDEPGSHLDDAGRAVTEAIMKDHRAGGLVLLATNDPREMGRADSRVELRGGLGHPA
jgi:heme exporter protein A